MLRQSSSPSSNSDSDYDAPHPHSQSTPTLRTRDDSDSPTSMPSSRDSNNSTPRGNYVALSTPKLPHTNGSHGHYDHTNGTTGSRHFLNRVNPFAAASSSRWNLNMNTPVSRKQLLISIGAIFTVCVMLINIEVLAPTTYRYAADSTHNLGTISNQTQIDVVSPPSSSIRQPDPKFDSAYYVHNDPAYAGEVDISGVNLYNDPRQLMMQVYNVSTEHWPLTAGVSTIEEDRAFDARCEELRSTYHVFSGVCVHCGSGNGGGGGEFMPNFIQAEWFEKRCDERTAAAQQRELQGSDPSTPRVIARAILQKKREEKIHAEIESCIHDGSCPHIAEKKPITVVAARYKEDVGWLLQLPVDKFEVVLITKAGGDTSRLNVPEHELKTRRITYIDLETNIADEAATYLHYLVENYDSRNFSDYTVFLHAHNNAWHMDGWMADRLLAYNFGVYPYMDISFDFLHCWQTFDTPWNTNVPENWMHSSLHYYDQVLASEPYYPEIHGENERGPEPIGKVLCNHATSQFAVSRERILAQPRHIYQRSLDFCFEHELPFSKSRMNSFEFTWHLIFGEPLQVTKFPTCIYVNCTEWMPESRAFYPYGW